MSAAAPWSVKGIDPKARETAKDMARQANMTLGEWLNRVILEDEVKPASGPVESRANNDDVGRVASALDQLSARIVASERQAAERPVAPGHVERELMAVAARFETAVQDLSSEHSRLSERLRRLEGEASGPRSAAALQSLERALGKVTERLYSGEDRLDDRLAGMETRLARAENNDPASALRGLSSSMTALDMRLKSIENSPDPRLEGRLSAIEVRVAEGLDSVNAQLEEGLDALDERASAALQRMGAQVVSVAQSLAGRLDGVEQRTQLATEQIGGDIAHLATSMEQRLGHADQVQAQTLEKLGEEITRITERLAERISAAEKRSASAMDDIGQHVARVTERLTQQQERASDDISERIRLSEERTASLIEQSRTTFENSLERARAAMIPLAAAASSKPKVERPAAKAPGASLAAAANWTLPSPFGDLPEAVFVDDDESFGQRRDAPATDAAQQAFVEEVEEEDDLRGSDLLAEPFFIDEIDDAIDDIAAEPDQTALFATPEDLEEEGLAQVEERSEKLPFGEDAGEAESDVDAPIWRSVDEFENGVFEPIETEPEAELEATPLAAAEDDEALFDTSRPLSTRQVIEHARAAARASAQETARRPSLLTSLGNRFSSTKGLPRNKLFGSAAFWVIALVGGGGIGMTATALWLMDQPRPADQSTKIAAGQPLQAAVAISETGDSTDLNAAQIAPAAKDGVDLAGLYAEGARRIEASDNGGLQSLQKAANLGYAPAQFYLSKLYESGQAGLTKDPVAARLWTQRAADNGEPKAMYNLGLDYYQGTGGAKDYNQAAVWFAKSASAGLSDGQFNLALLYERGVGVPQNAAEAYKWYVIAAKSGDAASQAEANGAAERVKGQLSADAAGIAERAAAAFRPTAGTPSLAAAASSSDVALVQRALNKLGYYNGPQDGVISPAVASAITAYQKDNGLPASGKVDPIVESKLQVFAR